MPLPLGHKVGDGKDSLRRAEPTGSHLLPTPSPRPLYFWTRGVSTPPSPPAPSAAGIAIPLHLPHSPSTGEQIPKLTFLRHHPACMTHSPPLPPPPPLALQGTFVSSNAWKIKISPRFGGRAGLAEVYLLEVYLLAGEGERHRWEETGRSR